MLQPSIPPNDALRVAAVKEYGILNSGQEETYNQITELATLITNMPIALISIVDKDEVWFKATSGLDICATDRSLSFCSHAVGNVDPVFIVEDAKNDARFKDHPFVTQQENAIGFYAGVCLIDKNGFRLGTLCVIDTKPNKISEKKLDALKILAKQIVKLIELHKANAHLKNIQENLEFRNDQLKSFAGIVSHDMKMPLANIIITTDILKVKYANQLDFQAKEYLAYLKQSSFTLSDYITGLLHHYESDQISKVANETFDIHHLLEEIVDLLNIRFDCEINFPDKNIDIHCNRAALEQIFLNLIGNSLKYNDKEQIVIDIDCKDMGDHYYFRIEDNGVGIKEDKQEEIFKLFSTVEKTDRDGKKGNGIGLSTVQKLISSLGGKINVHSNYGKNTTFEFTIKRDL